MSESSLPNDARPDLEDEVNVIETHTGLRSEQAAASREKRLQENGLEPVSLWIILLSGLVILVGGAVLGSGGKLFAYGDLVKDGYMRRPQPPIPGGEVVPVAIGAHLRAEGSKLYSKCVGCHQPDGQGQAGAFPPLAGSEWVTGDTEALALIILNGLSGPIEVKGTQWNSNMPAQADGLGAKELAAVMTFIRTEWGNDASIVTPEMAANAIEAGKAISGQVTADLLKSGHAKMLEGKELDPATLIDPDTWLPVEGAAE
ncbi:MAG: c-type cytochrome [Verrucomicrobiales bacterium]